MPSSEPPDKRYYSLDEMMERMRDVQAAKEGRSRKRRSVQRQDAFQRALVKVTIRNAKTSGPGSGFRKSVPFRAAGRASAEAGQRYRPGGCGIGSEKTVEPGRPR